MHYTQVFHSHLLSEDVVRQIERMPKVELHVHLEGATSPELIFAMAARNHISLPVSTLQEWMAFYQFRDFNHFIEVYLLSVACMLTPKDFADMVVDLMRRQASQNIQHSEVFLSAALHLSRLPADDILAGLVEGVRIGKQKYGGSIALIPDISRQTCVEKGLQEEVLTFALKAREQGVAIGLGIAGFEIGYPSNFYREVFDEARRQGLHVVAHAGETGDHAIVRDVVEVLRPERLGHGIHALGDPALVAELRDRQLPIEVSPQSNYCTRVAPLGEPHPIRAMVDAGLYCTVNTDDPAMFSTDLNNEYLTLAAQGFSMEELWALNLNGLKASFLEADEKEAMLRRWEAMAVPPLL